MMYFLFSKQIFFRSFTLLFIGHDLTHYVITGNNSILGYYFLLLLVFREPVADFQERWITIPKTATPIPARNTNTRVHGRRSEAPAVDS